MKIVDPHIHLWDLATGLYPGLERGSTSFAGDNTPIARSYLLEEFLLEGGSAFEVTKAVHVEAFPLDPLAEAKVIQAVADASPVPLVLVANADLSSPEAASVLAGLAAVPATRGIRQVVNLHPDQRYTYTSRDYLAEPAWQAGYALLAQHGLSFDLQLYPHQMAAAAAVVAANPETPVILNHAGMFVDRTLDGWRQWRAGLRTLAALPHVSAKTSGLGMFDHGWTVESIRPYVLEVLDAFGTDRVMFASNFPVDKLYSSYARLWQAFAEITADLPAPEREALFSRNAERIYRI